MSLIQQGRDFPCRPEGQRFLGLAERIEILDVGAAQIAEVPSYSGLLELGIGHLNTFEGDERQLDGIRQRFGSAVSVFDGFVFDGSEQTVHLAEPVTGMTSLLSPDPRALAFFNGFEEFGTIHDTELVRTVRLDDVEALPSVDFAKMDVQGSELTIMRNGTVKMERCLAVQLEVSFICLYEQQPHFGEVDTWMRAQGFAPHMFVDVKRWSVRPTIFNGNFRVAGNQLLEADIVYVRNPLELDDLDDTELRKLAVLSHHSFGSTDLCVHWMRELERRGAIPVGTSQHYCERLAGAHPYPLELVSP